MLFKHFVVAFACINLSSSTEDEPQDGDIQSAMTGVSEKLHADGCVMVLVHDESISTTTADSLLNKLQNDGRGFLVLDLTTRNLVKIGREVSTEQVERLASYLHGLYRLCRCFTFIIWLRDLRVLYPPDMNIHPGWRSQDVVIFASHHLGRKYNLHLMDMRFWEAIPNILGLRRQRPSLHECNRVVIFTVLPYGGRSGPIAKEVDYWLVAEKKFERNVPLLWDKFKSFNNVPLRHAILWKAPYYIFGDSSNPFVDGIDWRLLQLVYRYLHFSFNTSTVVSTDVSGCRHRGNWTGAIGFLQKGQADLAIGGLSSSGQRLADFDFTTIYYGDAYVFISPIKTKSPQVLDIFSTPLDSTVWEILLLTCVVVAFSIKYLAKLERKLTKRTCSSEVKYRDHHFTSFWHNIYFLYNNFCQKPFPHVPFSNPLKLTFIGTSLCITVIGIIFAGTLFSQLFHARKESSIDTFVDIVDSKLPLCVMNYDGVLNYGAKMAKRLTFKKMWAKATFANLFTSLKCIDDVVRGHGIYIDTYSRLHFLGGLRYRGVNGIKFHFGREKLLYQTNIGWVARKKWPFLPKVSNVLSRAVESGLVDHWMSIFQRGKFGWDQESINILRDLDPNLLLPTLVDETKNIDPTRHLSWDQRFVKLGFLQFGTVYKMWMYGMALGLIAFIGELTLHGTWTLVSFFRRLVRRILHFFRLRRLENELHALVKTVEGIPSPGHVGVKRKATRQQPAVIRYFMWTDLADATAAAPRTQKKTKQTQRF